MRNFSWKITQIVTSFLDWMKIGINQVAANIENIKWTAENPDNVYSLFWKSSTLSRPWTKWWHSGRLTSTKIILCLDNSLLNSSSKILIRCWLKLRLGLFFSPGKTYYVRSKIWPSHSWVGRFALNKYSFLIKLVASHDQIEGHLQRCQNKPADLKCLR